MDYKVVTILALVLVGSQADRPPLSSQLFPHSWLPDTSTWTSPCPCARVYEPQCGSDGRTYNNLCEFQCRYNFVLKRFQEELFILKHERCDSTEYETDEGFNAVRQNYGPADGIYY